MGQNEKERIEKIVGRLSWILESFLTSVWLILLVVSVVVIWAGSDFLSRARNAYFFVTLAGLILIIIKAIYNKKLKTLNQEKGGSQ